MTGDPLVRGECRDEEQDVGRLAASSWADGHELPGGVPRSELVDAEPVVAGTGPPASVIAEPPTTDQSVVGMTALVVEAEALRPDSSETDGTHPGTPLEVADAESPAGEGGQWGDLSIAPRDLPVTMWAGETLPSQVASSPLVRPRRRAAPILRILRGRVPPAGLASWSVPPPPGARLLVLSGQEVSRRVTALFALIEGEDAIVDLVHNALRHAFAPGSAADRLSIAAADRYLRGVLEQALVSAVPGKEGFGVETVLWIGTEALVCSLGDARTYLCRDLDLIRIQAMPGDDSPGRELRMARRAVQTGDRLVLLDSAAQRITDEELREALSSCPSLDDAAGWLAALARARGGDQPSVLVVQIGPGTGGDG
ncbi:MAG: hypothetical protein JOZ41_12530, partial [Chloroflexi bacterium]|nr:hypothetical protein [Chloroflexota bacterium]